MKTKKFVKTISEELMAAAIGGKIAKVKVTNRNTLTIKFYDGTKFDLEVNKYSSK